MARRKGGMMLRIIAPFRLSLHFQGGTPRSLMRSGGCENKHDADSRSLLSVIDVCERAEIRS